MVMSDDPSPEQLCLESQGLALLRASLLISIYSLFPRIVSSDAELLVNELLSPTTMQYVQQMTVLNDVLRRQADLVATASLPSLIVHATRRSSFDVVHAAVLQYGFGEKATELHDRLYVLRAEATNALPPRSMSDVPVSPPVSPPEPMQVDSRYICELNTWSTGHKDRVISWEDITSGPSHDRTFEVACRLNGEIIGRGNGKKKQIGKAQAAYDAAKFLGIAVDPNTSMLLADR